MGEKVKARHQKKPRHLRNFEALEMILGGTGKGRFHSDKRNRRGQSEKQWQQEEWL